MTRLLRAILSVQCVTDAHLGWVLHCTMGIVMPLPMGANLTVGTAFN